MIARAAQVQIVLCEDFIIEMMMSQDSKFTTFVEMQDVEVQDMG